ncbi:MAG: HAD family hydrolase [Candidatus Omnitrophota bacterium]
MMTVFLDRDGVINRYPGDRKYVTGVRHFHFLPGVLKAVSLLTKAGFRIYVISNQAGVSKGLYSRKALEEITGRMLEGIRKYGGRIDDVYYCLHTTEMNCSCRKPKAGLLKKATKACRVDLKSTYFIGDSLLDVKAGRAFGCKTILVLSGKEKLKNASRWDVIPDFIARNLLDAARHIIDQRYERA